MTDPLRSFHDSLTQHFTTHVVGLGLDAEDQIPTAALLAIFAAQQHPEWAQALTEFAKRALPLGQFFPYVADWIVRDAPIQIEDGLQGSFDV